MTGAVVALVYCDDEVDVGPVGDAFVLKDERVVDGNIAFAIHQLSDVASKGLSPGIRATRPTAENARDSVTDTRVRFMRRDLVHPAY